MNERITNVKIHCPRCAYCLNGLPIQGSCPECGVRYRADGPHVAEAARRFNLMIPVHSRFWMAARCEHRPRRGVLFCVLVLCAGVNAAAFVLMQYIAVRLAAPSPWGQRPENAEFIATVFGEVGSGWAKPMPWNGYGRILWSITFCGQICLAFVIRFWYTYAPRDLGPRRRDAALLGGYAMGSVVPAMALPIVLVSLWQYWNVSDPGRFYGLLEFFVLPYRFLITGRGDEIALSAFFVLLGGVCLTTVRLFRRHRRCIQVSADALRIVSLHPVQTPTGSPSTD